MAPELWEGGRSSPASDIYALGVILYEMVTGHRPFADHGGDALPKAPTSYAPSLSPKWNRAILRCLESSPRARPTDPTLVAQCLEGRPRHLTLVWTAAMLSLAVLGLYSVRERFWPPPSVRLAILSPAVSPTMTEMTEGLLQDVADRIGRTSAGPPS